MERGNICHFTYRCWESDESQHAQLWHHSGQLTTIINKLADVEEHDVGEMYRVEFLDGFCEDVFADELAPTTGGTT